MPGDVVPDLFTGGCVPERDQFVLDQGFSRDLSYCRGLLPDDRMWPTELDSCPTNVRGTGSTGAFCSRLPSAQQQMQRTSGPLPSSMLRSCSGVHLPDNRWRGRPARLPTPIHPTGSRKRFGWCEARARRVRIRR
jgi:hypothetical protein